MRESLYNNQPVIDLITTQVFLSKDRSPSYLPRESGTSHVPVSQLVP